MYFLNSRVFPVARVVDNVKREGLPPALGATDQRSSVGVGVQRLRTWPWRAVAAAHLVLGDEEECPLLLLTTDAGSKDHELRCMRGAWIRELNEKE
jgi:hypothetical protein